MNLATMLNAVGFSSVMNVLSVNGPPPSHCCGFTSGDFLWLVLYEQEEDFRAMFEMKNFKDAGVKHFDPIALH